MDEKNKEKKVKPDDKVAVEEEKWYDNRVMGMKDDMEDYIEEQGIYIRQ